MIRNSDPCPTCGSIHDELMAAVQDAEATQKAAFAMLKKTKPMLDAAIAVCNLAGRAVEVVFDDPGDAVRWGEAVNAYNAAQEAAKEKP